MAGAARPMGLTDPMFTAPFVDVDEWRDDPVRHRYVHGGFDGTDCRFSMYFPDATPYHGRFFHPVSPVPGSEHGATEGAFTGYIEFAVASGGYLVESNLGRFRRALRGEDSTVAGYRASAAVARYSRVLAAEMYGEHRPYGYVFGGSGGAYRAIACIENGDDVWDGAVPYIHGTLQSMPSMFSVQAHAFRVLGPKLPQIVDAVEPGGSGDMYAGLSDRGARRARRSNPDGLSASCVVRRRARSPPVHDRVGRAYSTTSRPGTRSYFDDFWTVPGYLGANPTESLLAAKVEHKSRIARLVLPPEARERGLPIPMALRGLHVDDVPVAYVLEEVPAADLTGAMVRFTSGRAADHHVWISGQRGDYITTGIGQEEVEHLRKVDVGDEVLVDNTPYLAFQTYHRHQVPPGDEYPEYEQFRACWPTNLPAAAPAPRSALRAKQRRRQDGWALRGEDDRRPEPVRRDRLPAAGRVVPQSGRGGPRRSHRRPVPRLVHRPRDAPGPRGDAAIDLQPDRATHVVNYRGVLEQALRDVAAWVERGIAPPPSTNYEWVDGQIRAAGHRGRAPRHPAARPADSQRWRAGRRRRRRSGGILGARRGAPRRRHDRGRGVGLRRPRRLPRRRAVHQRGPLVHVDTPRPRVRLLRARHLLPRVARHVAASGPRRQPARAHHEPGPCAGGRELKPAAGPGHSGGRIVQS